MTGTLVFDIETKKLAQEVGGWSNISRMGFAAGVTYGVESQKMIRFTEDSVYQLIQSIQQANAIIGFNLIRFDYEVLRPYGLMIDLALQRKSLDLMLSVEQALGFRVGLGKLAEAMLGQGKSADGVQSVEWYRQGEIDKVLAYCEQDVLVTFEIWEFGRANHHIFYRDRSGRKRPIPVHW